MSTNNLTFGTKELEDVAKDRFSDETLCDFTCDESVPEVIEKLLRNLEPRPLGYYIRQYLWQKHLKHSFPDLDQVPEKEYLRFIRQAFADNGMGNNASLFENDELNKWAKTQLSLAEKDINPKSLRDSVFSWAFGLNMSLEDVSMFLQKVIRQNDFNFWDPIEVIFWWCFKNNLGYIKMLEIKHAFDELMPSETDGFKDENTAKLGGKAEEINNGKQLMEYLAKLKATEHNLTTSETARLKFCELLDEFKKTIVIEQTTGDLRDSLHDAISNNKSASKIDESRKNLSRIQKPEDITSGAVESKLYESNYNPSINNNLFYQKKSNLGLWFDSTKLRRGRIDNISKGIRPVKREDILTLYFWVYCANSDSTAHELFKGFRKRVNKILKECRMQPLYLPNPYESFLAICLLSAEPEDTFKTIWDSTLVKTDKEKATKSKKKIT